MKRTTYLQALFTAACCIVVITSCNNNNDASKTGKEAATKDTVVKKPVVEAKPAESKRGPIINITDTLSVKRIVITVKDSAATMPRISIKLAEIYGIKLAAVLKKNNLKTTGSPIAWYKSEKPPYFFEAGLPVDKRPSKPGPGVQVKEIGIDSIVVAHFYGPYELIPQAYDALRDWIKDHKKKAKGAPYEIYIDEPVEKDGRPKDPYKVQTDIVFPWK